MTSTLVAVLDIGKTHSKLLVVDATTGATRVQFERASRSVASPLGAQLDVAGIEQWLLECFSRVPERDQIGAIVPIAHGAAAVLLDVEGTVLAAPDYENDEFEELADDYRQLRDPFAHTYSPFLSRGLNLGRQLHWLQHRAPDLFARCTSILTYAQYWAWRFSGIQSCELTSLGCHTDLWRPVRGEYSNLATRQGWAARCAPVRRANETLGTLSPEWVQRCGLNALCRVVCGIHDSNASYLAHRLSLREQQPFTAVSSGTWTVLMARGVELNRLVEAQDMLANVDAFGEPVGTARFAGGREYQAICAAQRPDPTSDPDALRTVLAHEAMALPSFSSSGGPFATRAGQLVNSGRLLPSERTALASLYLALMTDFLMERLGASGEILIDGPLARNPLYGRVLSSLRSDQVVRNCDSRLGPVQAGIFLAGHSPPLPQPLPPIHAVDTEAVLAYRARWRELVRRQA